MDKDERAARLKQIETDARDQLQPVFKGVSVVKTGSHRQVASKEARKKPRRGFHFAGSLLFLGGILGIVVSALGISRTLGDVGLVGVVCGFICWLVSDWKQTKRIREEGK